MSSPVWLETLLKRRQRPLTQRQLQALVRKAQNSIECTEPSGPYGALRVRSSPIGTTTATGRPSRGRRRTNIKTNRKLTELFPLEVDWGRLAAELLGSETAAPVKEADEEKKKTTKEETKKKGKKALANKASVREELATVSAKEQPTKGSEKEGICPSDQDRTKDLICSACLLELVDETGPSVAILSCCLHLYHHDCIERWALTENTCCQCKQRFLCYGVYDAQGSRTFWQTVRNTNQHYNPDAFLEDINPCHLCNSIGDRESLMECEGCSHSVHFYCLGMEERMDEYMCDSCTRRPEEVFTFRPGDSVEGFMARIGLRTPNDIVRALVRRAPALTREFSPDAEFDDDDSVIVQGGRPPRIARGTSTGTRRRRTPTRVSRPQVYSLDSDDEDYVESEAENDEAAEDVPVGPAAARAQPATRRAREPPRLGQPRRRRRAAESNGAEGTRSSLSPPTRRRRIAGTADATDPLVAGLDSLSSESPQLSPNPPPSSVRLTEFLLPSAEPHREIGESAEGDALPAIWRFPGLGSEENSAGETDDDDDDNIPIFHRLESSSFPLTGVPLPGAPPVNSANSTVPSRPPAPSGVVTRSAARRLAAEPSPAAAPPLRLSAPAPRGEVTPSTSTRSVRAPEPTARASWQVTTHRSNGAPTAPTSSTSASAQGNNPPVSRRGPNPRARNNYPARASAGSQGTARFGSVQGLQPEAHADEVPGSWSDLAYVGSGGRELDWELRKRAGETHNERLLVSEKSVVSPERPDIGDLILGTANLGPTRHESRARRSTSSGAARPSQMPPARRSSALPLSQSDRSQHPTESVGNNHPPSSSRRYSQQPGQPSHQQATVRRSSAPPASSFADAFQELKRQTSNSEAAMLAGEDRAWDLGDEG